MEPRRCKNATTWTYWISLSTLRGIRLRQSTPRNPSDLATAFRNWDRALQYSGIGHPLAYYADADIDSTSLYNTSSWM